ncbi:Heart- and neural crest derivatives-expressed protein 1 [Chelonia mydas]|uniref:Heart- and neural crest derivatives-expressed protein 1 n=1 Tax=Chelonia mydas TaxID=8469 RepID=M7BIN7_CHEMY|nr:Heart- and neural crest derivatives-expressed protein 1 [Chelonia mydas]
MNLVGSYQHHLLHEPFLFSPASRCHPERSYFQSWVLNPAEVSPDLSGQPSPYTSAEFGAPGPGHGPSRLGALSGRPGPRQDVGRPKKERRRTESINSAFAELRECIPNVPADTKLSKIKPLRLAPSYIAYLMEVLAKDSQAGETEGFKAELKKTSAGGPRASTAPSPSCGSASPTYIAYLMEVLAKDSQAGETEGFKAELKKTDSRESKRKREPASVPPSARSGSPGLGEIGPPAGALPL